MRAHLRVIDSATRCDASTAAVADLRRLGLALQTPVIVKYRDERTDIATALEAWLR